MTHFLYYLAHLAPGYTDRPAWWLGAAVPAAWLVLSGAWLGWAVAREQMAVRREARVAGAKRRHPARGTRSLEDGLEWLRVLEALALDEMAEGQR